LTTLNINEHAFTYGVISRRNINRAGTRYERISIFNKN